MTTTRFMLNHLQCHETTESGHDEVFFSTTVTRRRGAATATNDSDVIGPSRWQRGNAGGPGGDDTAWDVNDSGALADQAPDVEMFDVAVADDEIVVVTLTFKESDGQNLADQEAQAAAASAAVLGAVTVLFPPAVLVTAPVGAGIAAVSAVALALRGWLTNKDDTLGSIAFVIEGRSGRAPLVTQVSPSPESRVGKYAAAMKPAWVQVGMFGGGSSYTFTVGVDGALYDTVAARAKALGI